MKSHESALVCRHDAREAFDSLRALRLKLLSEWSHQLSIRILWGERQHRALDCKITWLAKYVFCFWGWSKNHFMAWGKQSGRHDDYDNRQNILLITGSPVTASKPKKDNVVDALTSAATKFGGNSLGLTSPVSSNKATVLHTVEWSTLRLAAISLQVFPWTIAWYTILHLMYALVLFSSQDAIIVPK